MPSEQFVAAMKLIGCATCATVGGPLGAVAGGLVGEVGGQLVGKLVESFFGTTLGGISGNLAVEHLKDLTEQVGDASNHDLQKALAAATELAARSIREERGAQLGKRLPREEDRFFDEWLKQLRAAQEGGAALEALFAGGVTPEAVLHAATAAEEQAAWDRFAAQALTGGSGPPLSGDLRHFIAARLPEELPAALAEIFKDPRYARAWISFSRDMLVAGSRLVQGLQRQVAAADAGQRQELAALRERLDLLSAAPDLLAGLTRSTGLLLSQVGEGQARLERAAEEQAAELAHVLRALEEVRHLAAGRFLWQGAALDFPRRRPVDDLVEELAADREPFVGRGAELDALAAFARGGGALLVTAPAGGGKSTLLARWLRGLREDRPDTALCYHFFNALRGTQDVDGFLASLAEQLLKARGIQGDVRESEPARLRSLIYQLLSMPHATGLLVVIDGLDQARDPHRPEDFALPRGLFPPAPGEGIALVLSARPVASRGPAEEMRERLGLARLAHLPLEELDQAAATELLRRSGSPELAARADDPVLTARLVERTAGLAIYLRQLVAELAHSPERQWERVLDELPRDFEAFVAQIARTEALDREWDEALSVLAFARGWLSEDDLAELAGLRRRDFDRIPWGAARWLTVREGKERRDPRLYALQHPAIAHAYRARFHPREAREYGDRIMAYCARWREHHSAYAFLHYPFHLRDAEAWDQLTELFADGEFLMAGEDSGFLRWHRLETDEWQELLHRWVRHLLSRHADGAALAPDAQLAIATVYLDAFWWWGEYIPWPFCEQLRAAWQDHPLGARDPCLAALGELDAHYPRSRDHRGRHRRREAWQRTEAAVRSLRVALACGSGASPADRRRLHLAAITAVFLGDARHYQGCPGAWRHYQEADRILRLRDGGAFLLAEDQWSRPYVHHRHAEMWRERGRHDRAARICHRALRDALAGEGEEELDCDARARLFATLAAAHAGQGREDAAWEAYAGAAVYALRYQACPHPPDRYTIALYEEITERVLDGLRQLAPEEAVATRCAALRALWQPHWEAELATAPLPPAPVLAGWLRDAPEAELRRALFPPLPTEGDRHYARRVEQFFRHAAGPLAERERALGLA